MHGAGPGHYRTQTAEAMAFTENMRQHRDFTLDEIVDTIPSNMLTPLQTMDASYQWPPDLMAEQTIALTTLECNTNCYDDDIEDYLDQDLMLGQLLSQKQRDPGSEALARAIRIRRTIVVRSMLEDILALSDQNQTDSPAA